MLSSRILFAAAVTFTGVVHAAPPPSSDPAAILRQCSETCAALRSGRYHAAWEIRDEGTSQTVEGDVTFLRWPTEAPPTLSASAPSPGPDGSMPATALIAPKLNTLFNADLRIDLATGECRSFNHERAAVWNPGDNSFKIMAAMDGGEKLIVQDTTVMLLDTPLLALDSIDRLLKMAERLTLEPRENIHGFECDVIVARMPKLDAQTDVTISVAVGVADHLPRRTVFEQLTDGKSTLRHTVIMTSVRPDAPVNADVFALQSPEGATVESIKPQPPPELLAKGDAAPQFTLQDQAGKSVSFADFKGRIVLLDFWGTWCGPCKMAMPAIQKVHAKYKDRGVVVIGISCREKPNADPVKTMSELGCDYGLLLHGETITRDWHVPGYPTLYVIDRDGNIAHAELGYDEELEGKLSEVIDGLLKQ